MRLASELKYRLFMAGGPPSSKGPGSGHYDHGGSHDVGVAVAKQHGYTEIPSGYDGTHTQLDKDDEHLFIDKRNGSWMHMQDGPTTFGDDSSNLAAFLASPKPKEEDVPEMPDHQYVDGNGFTTGGNQADYVDHHVSYTKDEIEAAKDYEGSGYAELNKFLFAKASSTEDESELRAKVRNLDSLINKGSLNKDAILWRGLGGKAAQDLVDTLKVGDIYQPKCFQSTSVHQSFAHQWATDPDPRSNFFGYKKLDNVVLKLNAPEGTHAYAFSGKEQAEILLPRNISYRVTDIYRNAGKVYIAADVIGGGASKKIESAKADKDSASDYVSRLLDLTSSQDIDAAFGKMLRNGKDITPPRWQKLQA